MANTNNNWPDRVQALIKRYGGYDGLRDACLKQFGKRPAPASISNWLKGRMPGVWGALLEKLEAENDYNKKHIYHFNG